MCAACVAQGAVYVGGALTGLQVMAARARHRRGGATPVDEPAGDAGAAVDEPAPAAPPEPVGGASARR
jgi:hypothetical protein